MTGRDKPQPAPDAGGLCACGAPLTTIETGPPPDGAVDAWDVTVCRRHCDKPLVCPANCANCLRYAKALQARK